MQHARIHMNGMFRAPDRLLWVFDLRPAAMAELADEHLAVRPGTGAWCVAAILGRLVQARAAT